MTTTQLSFPVMNGARKSPRVEGHRDVFMKLSSAIVAHVLDFLEIQDKVSFLSTNTTNAKEPLTFSMKTYCGTCQACLAKTEYLCTRSRERLWTSKAWTSIFRRFGLGMQELHLAGCNGIVTSVFNSMQAKQMLASISVLRVDHCNNFPIEAIAEIAKYCCNLRQLHLHDLAVKDEMVSAIIASNASTLKVVDFKGCHALKGSFLNAIAEQSVEDLNLQGCHNLDISTLETTAPYMKTIKRLNLRFCHKVTDKTIHCIVQHMPKLQDLNLRYCYKVTDAGVSALCEHAPKLHCLNLSQCWRLTDKAIW
ncbi:hypothetical protein THRCLA_11092 [Thraustotheca clavata]|uniref:F-box/LRR-repeat protein 15-like leucin rich repeat domain-containing protein n=1 Tax=Thraustotheca clavata TaxID=74557 RepID=A0A1V9Y8U2_9STRA|nr:hypothetical protein THRCLA_11092 [Thraustotheca clavata]